MAWGRKRAVLGEPGQLDKLYRYPNGHPHTGSAQVNISSPNLTRHSRFASAKLREVVVGPGDVFYLPAFWWHQFEQPFEDTASLNIWSVPTGTGMGNTPVERELLLHDNLEAAAVKSFGKKSGVLLGALAQNAVSKLSHDARPTPKGMKKLQKLAHANATLLSMADRWRSFVVSLPNVDAAKVPTGAELVAEFLELSHRDVVSGSRWPGWKPGDAWDMSGLTSLETELRSRCKPAPGTATFASVCESPPAADGRLWRQRKAEGRGHRADL